GAVRTGIGRVDQRHRAWHSHVRAHTGWDGLGEHVSCRQLSIALRRLQIFRSGPRERHRCDPELSPGKERLDQHGSRHRQPVRDALNMTAGDIMTPDAATAKQQGDPLLDEWTGPHGGFPRFDMVKVAAFKPSIERGMELKRLEIAAIAGHSAAPDFENTFAALDGSGRPFSRATRIFRIYTATMNDKSVQAADTELAPVLSAFHDEIAQHEALCA